LVLVEGFSGEEGPVKVGGSAGEEEEMEGEGMDEASRSLEGRGVGSGSGSDGCREKKTFRFSFTSARSREGKESSTDLSSLDASKQVLGDLLAREDLFSRNRRGVVDLGLLLSGHSSGEAAALDGWGRGRLALVRAGLRHEADGSTKSVSACRSQAIKGREEEAHLSSGRGMVAEQLGDCLRTKHIVRAGLRTRLLDDVGGRRGKSSNASSGGSSNAQDASSDELGGVRSHLRLGRLLAALVKRNGSGSVGGRLLVRR
jgi:hypothetical protein